MRVHGILNICTSKDTIISIELDDLKQLRAIYGIPETEEETKFETHEPLEKICAHLKIAYVQCCVNIYNNNVPQTMAACTSVGAAIQSMRAAGINNIVIHGNGGSNRPIVMGLAYAVNYERKPLQDVWRNAQVLRPDIAPDLAGAFALSYFDAERVRNDASKENNLFLAKNMLHSCTMGCGDSTTVSLTNFRDCLEIYMGSLWKHVLEDIDTRKNHLRHSLADNKDEEKKEPSDSDDETLQTRKRVRA